MYDAVGNRLSVLELDGSAVAYAYDPAYELTNEQRSGTTPYNTTFVYDGMGNQPKALTGWSQKAPKWVRGSFVVSSWAQNTSGV